MPRPLIGLTGQRSKAKDTGLFLGVLDESDLDMFLADYARGVAAAGGLPVFIPFDSDLAELTAELDGLLLTGGTDISPTLYGAIPEPQTEQPELPRDEFELELFRNAEARALPVLGVCRGLQLINVAGGGTLNQHVPEHAFLADGPSKVSHTVNFDVGSKLSSIYGPSREVNSLHHQTVHSVASGLVASGRSDDESVEAVENPDLPIVGVQWHPEMMTGRSTDPIFKWLVDSATERQSR